MCFQRRHFFDPQYSLCTELFHYILAIPLFSLLTLKLLVLSFFILMIMDIEPTLTTLRKKDISYI